MFPSLFRRVQSYVRYGWVKVEEDVSDSLDLAGPSRLPSTSPQDDTSPPVEAKRFVSLAEAFSTAEKLPRFTMAQILHYFVWRTAVDGLPNADSKSISESAMNLSQGGHIQQIMVNTTDDSLEFKGVCRAEMKKKAQYNIAFIISRATSVIAHAVCGCPAGKGPQATCKHIGAFCFTLEVFCRIGKLRDFVTCTDQLQVWHQPKAAKPHMIAVAELVSRRKEIKTPPAISPPPVRQTSFWDPRPTHLRKTNAHAIEQLRCDLLQAGSNCGLLQVLPVSTEVALQDHSYTTLTVTASRSSTPPLSEPSDTAAVHSCISAYTVDDLDAVKHSLNVTMEEREIIMQATVGQAKSGVWHQQHAKRITGSKASKVLVQKKKTVSLLTNILYPKPFTSPATQWGQLNEKVARLCYVQYWKQKGIEVRVVECGLIVHPSKGFLAASPDGIVEDTNIHETGLLEIKCPYSKRNSLIKEACADGSFFCTMNNSELQLKRQHNYYHQVQLQLYCHPDAAWCDFFVYTSNDCECERVYRDIEWQQQSVPELERYFDEWVAPELIRPQYKPPYYL